MTEKEWPASIDLDGMLAIRQVRNRKRKLRLFTVGCCRQLARWVPDDRLWDVLVACERYADGEIKESGLGRWQAVANRVWVEAENAPRKRNHAARIATIKSFAHTVMAHRFARTGADRADNTPLRILGDESEFGPKFLSELRAIYPALLRDIFGNPFRPVAFDPVWRTATAVGLAQTMYDARHFNAMPILADALQDAGCEDAAILGHCRDADGVHVRGCWVVDLVLGKS